MILRATWLSKCLILALVALSGSLMVHGQTAGSGSKPIQEVGLAFSGLNSFGIRYKVGSERNLFRLTTFATHFSQAKDTIMYFQKSNFSSWGITLEAGMERRFRLTGDLFFHAGAGLQGGYAYRTYKENDESVKGEITYSNYGIRLILGFTYQWKERWIFSVETAPAFLYNYYHSHYTIFRTTFESQEYSTTYESLSFRFYSTFAVVTVAYRFGKK